MIPLTIKKINERKIAPVKTAISPQFWGHLLKSKPMFDWSKTRLITSPQNWVYLNQSKTGLVNKEER